MNKTHSAVLGDRGRLVLPARLRDSQGWEQGTPLLFVEAEGGVVVATRDQAKALIRQQLRGDSLVDELIADRRKTAHVEDAA